MVHKIRFILISLLFAGCAASTKKPVPVVQQQEPGPVLDVEKLNENFDPATLHEPVSVIKPKAREVKATTTAIRRAVPEHKQRAAEMMGYRVQILQTRDPEQARQIRNDALLELDAETYSIFDSPYYKVRAGDFETRYEADLFLKKCIEKGYTGAWIVRTKIKTKAATQVSDSEGN